MSTLREKRALLISMLSRIYKTPEAEVMAVMLLEEALGIDRAALSANGERILTKEELALLEEWTARLLQHEPVQYVLGHAWFYGLKFKVTSAVLIPRRETEELADLIIRENRNKQVSVLDIGTGSGCIAITLKKNMPFSAITAIDISAEALKVAEENSRELDAAVTFMQADVLQQGYLKSAGKFDIIVSNPPYVTESEKVLMNKNVKDFEPALALFVSDDDPLKFYRAIVSLSLQCLNPGGKIWFEINESYAREVDHLLQEAGFKQVRTIKDMQGKERILNGQWTIEN